MISLKYCILTSMLALSIISCGAGVKENPSNPFDKLDRPVNIIWIMADDLGFGDLGVYGQQHIRTPRLDQMAAEGTRYTQFYSGHAVCAPARSALMTGQHTGQTRIRNNFSVVTGERVPLLPEDTTVAMVLKDADYTTGLIGKWGLGEPGTSGLPNLKGFDYFYGFLNQQRAHTYYPDYVWRNTEKVVLEGNLDGKRTQYSHDLDVAEARNFIKQNKDNPFFLYLAFQIPHAEMQVPDDSLQEYLDEEGNSIFDETPFPPDAHPHYAPTEVPYATYAAMVSRLDRDIGGILDLLQELGLEQNTMVFFTSDNGSHISGGYDYRVFEGNGPLRGYKAELYEGGIRVPMIVRMPGTVPAGRVSDFVWAMWDFMPTAAEIAGTTPPADINGISVVDDLLGRPGQQEHEYLYWEFRQGRASMQAVRMGDWKAIRTDAGSSIELYDLSTDIGEKIDLAAQHPDIVARALELFLSARTENPDYPLETKEL